MRMASHNQNPVVVAIDKDKNSSSAVKWAIENLVTTNTTLILVHFKNKNFNNYSSQGGFSETYDESNEDVFTHPRAYCARKKVIMQEVVLEGTDVHNTLLDYINNHHVTNIVLGASSRNPITRKFWSLDVPTMINRGAPDFCSVYVISRGRTQSVRPAARQALASSTPPRFPSPLSSPRASDNGCRAPHVKEDRKSTASSHMIKPEKTVTDGSMDHRHNEIANRWSKTSFGDNPEVSSRHFSSSYNSTDTDLSDPFETGSMDITQVNIPNGSKYMGETTNHERTHSYLSSSSNELQRLKLEVKQTMNMYNSACKQAISAQHQVDELHQMKQDEVNRVEHARLAEEAANALIEVEKAKCRAAIEAAEKAQKIAERETQRRKHAEQKAKREAEEKNRALDILSKNDIRYRKYTIDEIEAATNKFSRSMKIGEGGYGPVYKGKLDHTRVAIKVLRSDAAQGRKQFQQEVEVLSFMRHPNMVLLMGACPEYGCLVYEYMNNGSLEDRLFRKGNTPPIPWGIRFKLASDIATGLLFLHQAKSEPLVHRDLKPGNILLDRHYTCKISDVGLARLVPPSIVDSVTQYHMTNAAGTFCYIDPEYQQTGKLGTKSDIYSLGVMLLQIITARPPMGLTHHVEKAIETGTFGDLLDPTVPDWPVEEAIEYARLALKCTELRKRDRPDLCKDILPELNRLKEFGMEHELRHRNSSHR
ncbi:hypothetical protein BUALT_Bualt05G0008400 [Buddleja alternifolia]|uniref:RING-type E3 ubiquitin transferase n=1 Tax=Buddleja alternifolia TaxID=168488 RepID=A0AAV6XP19_9LAMI|nr:hypothetical protein BUALT_Bualt05G0008400 [Buddleja alternifolia]